MEGHTGTPSKWMDIQDIIKNGRTFREIIKMDEHTGTPSKWKDIQGHHQDKRICWDSSEWEDIRGQYRVIIV